MQAELPINLLATTLFASTEASTPASAKIPQKTGFCHAMAQAVLVQAGSVQDAQPYTNTRRKNSTWHNASMCTQHILGVTQHV
jgi:hypothetical protein